MKILIASPLYPPDIAPLSVYVKELATRLKSDFDITIVAYTHIPEVIHGVRIIAVPKDIPLIPRLIRFTLTLWKEALRTDVLYIQNGPSVELPARIVCALVRVRSIFHISDPVAFINATKESNTRQVFHSILRRVNHIIRDPKLTIPDEYGKKTTESTTPGPRPEILPFTQYPTAAFTQYEKEWDTHITELKKIFHYGTK